MYLTAEGLIPYLQQRGILTARALLDDEWFVVQRDPSRPVLFASNTAGRGWVVKQASPLDITHVRQLDREAAIYRLSQVDAWARPLRSVMPEYVQYDPGVHALVTRQLPYESCWTHLRRVSARPEPVGRALGRALAASHLPLDAKVRDTMMLPSLRPWVLEIGDAREAARPAGPTRLHDLIREEPALRDGLAAAARQWRAETLVHGDVKLDNVLVRASARPRAWLVDWGMAHAGDPAWDVGSVVQSAFVLWLHGIPFRRDSDLADVQAEAAYPFDLVRSFARAVLGAYAAATGRSGRSATNFARRSLALGGARLVQAAFEQENFDEGFTTTNLAMLQVAARLLEDPERAAEELLGA